MRFWRRQSNPPQSLFNPEKLDLVTQGQAGEANLYVIQDQPWIGSAAEIESLEQKLRTYVTFALDGQMHELYPELRGQEWRIIIDSYVGPPDERCWARLSILGDEIRDRGGDLILQELTVPIPPESVPHTERVRRVGSDWPEGEPVEL